MFLKPQINPPPSHFWTLDFDWCAVAFLTSTGDQSVSSPEAIAGPTPLTLQSALAAPWRSSVFCSFLNAFFVSCITTRGVFICTKLTKLGRNFPR